MFKGAVSQVCKEHIFFFFLNLFILSNLSPQKTFVGKKNNEVIKKKSCVCHI